MFILPTSHGYMIMVININRTAQSRYHWKFSQTVNKLRTCHKHLSWTFWHAFTSEQLIKKSKI